jgi:hypothetical protein
MADLIGVVGNTGSGKSTSLRNLNPNTTFIINVAGKALPFKGWKKNYRPLTQDPVSKKFSGNLYNSADVSKILQVLKMIDKQRPEIKVIAIEDSQYLMAFEAMERSSEKSYEKFTQMASNFYSILKESMGMRVDLKVCFLAHAENTGDNLNPSYKIKTLGKMIDNMITVEGLFTYVLFTILSTDVEGNIVHKFVTQSDGTTTAKTPMGCFDSMLIDNDLQYVVEKIDEYNEG